MHRIDRRAARTRKALHAAMISLIARRGYDALTVKDILDEADVGRSTFYAHYAGKADLLRGGFEQLREDLKSAHPAVARGVGRNEPPPFSRAFFAHAEGYKDVYRALGSPAARALAHGHIRTALAEAVQREWPRRADAGAVPTDLARHYVLNGFLSVLTWWLEQRPDLGASEADGLFRRLVLGGVDGLA